MDKALNEWHDVWRDVREEIPADGRMVLCYTDAGCQIGTYDGATDTWYDSANGRAAVTHWMELPDCPEVDDETY